MNTAIVRWIAALWIGISVSAAWAIGPSPDRDWRTAETTHFRLHFEERHQALAERIAGIAERFRPRITDWLNWQPREKTEIIVADYSDQANGMATPMPYNTMFLFTAPPDEGELLQNAEWMELVFIHEFIHIVHLDKARNTPLGARDVFGRFPLLFPNVFQPNWLTEGLATYGESFPDQKIGRLRNSVFEALMRVEAQRGFLSLREANAGGRGLPMNRAYLYGAYFYDFMARRYGVDTVRILVERYSGNLLPFRIVSNAQAVTGKPMDVLWQEYLDDLRARFQPQVDRLRSARHPVIASILAAPDLGGLAQDADGRVYVVRYDGITRAQLIRKSDNENPVVLAELSRAARIDVAPDGTILIAQPEVSGNHDLHFDLYRLSAGASEPVRLTTGGRWREAAWWPGRNALFIAALRMESDGTQAIWRLDLQGRPVEKLQSSGPQATWLGLAADAQRERLVWVSQRDKRWQLNEWTPTGVRVLLDDAAIKHSPKIDSEGRLWFIADYDDVPNVWSMDLNVQGTAIMQRHTRTDTAITGFAAPAKRLLAFRELSLEGERIIQWRSDDALESRPATVPSTPAVASVPPRIALTTNIAYSPWRDLRPRAWFPAFQLADGAMALGAQIFGSDPLGLHRYTAMPMWEVTQRETLGNLSYVYDERFAMAAARQMRVTSTEANRGRTISTYTIDDALQALVLQPLVRRDWQVYAGLGGSLVRATAKAVDGPSLRFQDERVAGVVLGYDSRSVQWRSEGPSQGFKAEAVAEQGLAGGAFPGRAWHLHAQAFVPIGPSVLAVRLRWGEAEADAEPFRLGGTDLGNALTMPQINQRTFALRGYDGDALTGRTFRLGTVEWRIPIADIDRHLMVPPVGLNRLSFTLFGEAGQAAYSGQPLGTLRSRGVELFGETRLGYLLPIEVRLGYVQAMDQQREKRSYLLMGRAF